MGCIHSKKRKDALRKNKKVTGQPRKKYLPDQNEAKDDSQSPKNNVPEFSDRQKEIVVESWKLVQDDLGKIGVQMFLQLFASHPDVQDAFMPFKGMSKEDLSHSNQLKSHANKVMGTVDKCLQHIQDTGQVAKMLTDLGARHIMYTAKVDYMDLIGPQFICAIEPVMGDKWNSEMEQAWSDLFKLIAHIMKAAMTF